jgi:hypothetical protein
MITLGGDLRVGRIGYGAMRLTGPNLWGEYADRDGGIALLRQAAEAGVTLIDTADVYGPHANELLIREALHPYPEHLVIATKGGFVRGGPVGARPALIDAIGNANYLRQCAYLSARRLGVERIDLYYLHSGRARDASFEDQVGTLAELRQLARSRHHQHCAPSGKPRCASHRTKPSGHSLDRQHLSGTYGHPVPAVGQQRNSRYPVIRGLDAQPSGQHAQQPPACLGASCLRAPGSRRCPSEEVRESHEVQAFG